MGMSKSEQAEWNRMNAENAKAAESSKTGGKPVVTNGNTGRGNGKR